MAKQISYGVGDVQYVSIQDMHILTDTLPVYCALLFSCDAK